MSSGSERTTGPGRPDERVKEGKIGFARDAEGTIDAVPRQRVGKDPSAGPRIAGLGHDGFTSGPSMLFEAP